MTPNEQIAEPVGDTLEDNVRYLLDNCPHTVRDLSGDRTGMRGREDLAGSLAITFLKMQKLAGTPNATPQPAPAPQPDQREVMRQALGALMLSKGALMEVSPCMEPECGQIQRDCIEAAERTSGIAIAALRQALAAKEQS